MADPFTVISGEILAKLCAGFEGGMHVRFWDGSEWRYGSNDADFTMVLNNPAALRAMYLHLSKQSVGFGEAYMFNDFNVEGDFLAFTGWLSHIMANQEKWSVWWLLDLANQLRKLPKPDRARDQALAGKPTKGDHRIERDREAISYTYDIPPEVYELFLDRHLQYTCGYFKTPDDDLDTAQENKMDLICRKLRLKPGERFADFGCGWGGLLMFAAKHYGVEATGFTLSKVQAEYARQAVEKEGLQGKVQVELCDFREFRPQVLFDKAASVGVAEHIGHKNLPLFFGKIYECLRPGGLYLHHTINLAPGRKRPKWTDFSHKYVFPNGEMQSIIFVIATGSAAGLEIRDVENLREHYVPTLEHWVRKLETHHDRIVELVGEPRFRVFRLYMAGATFGFRKGVYHLSQSLFSKPNNGTSEVPPTRADIYA